VGRLGVCSMHYEVLDCEVSIESQIPANEHFVFVDHSVLIVGGYLQLGTIQLLMPKTANRRNHQLDGTCVH
jgi:hypothetical protein